MKKKVLYVTLGLLAIATVAYAAGAKISALDNLAAPATGDKIAVNDVTDASKTYSITIGNLLGVGTDLGANGVLGAETVDSAEIVADAVGTSELEDSTSAPPDAGDFVAVQDAGTAGFQYITSHAGTNIAADLEEEVTEGSLADNTIVSADIQYRIMLFFPL